MNLRTRWLIAVLSIGVLGGCANVPLVMTAAGPEPQLAPRSSEKNIGMRRERLLQDQKTGQYAVLELTYSRAYNRKRAVAGGEAAPDVQADNFLYLTLAQEGMGAVDLNCSDFFDEAGDHERDINFSRDIVGFAGTLATGSMALSHAAKSAVAAVGLTTATLYSGLDIYTKNFLFAAENIDSVRVLIFKALDAHKKEALKDDTEWTFENAMYVILAHQDVCRSSSIVSLVRSAIKAGTVTAASDSASSTPATALRDQELRMLIGANAGFDKGTPATDDALAALYWFYITDASSPSATDEPIIKAKLKANVKDGPYDKDGNLNPASQHQSDIKNELSQLSTGVVDKLKKIIDKWKADGEKKAAAGEPTPSEAAKKLDEDRAKADAALKAKSDAKAMADAKVRRTRNPMTIADARKAADEEKQAKESAKALEDAAKALAAAVKDAARTSEPKTLIQSAGKGVSSSKHVTLTVQ